MDWIVNNIQLKWKLARMLKTYKTCNSTVRFPKYKFYNKLLGSVTYTQPLNKWIDEIYAFILSLDGFNYTYIFAFIN